MDEQEYLRFGWAASGWTSYINGQKPFQTIIAPRVPRYHGVLHDEQDQVLLGWVELDRIGLG